MTRAGALGGSLYRIYTGSSSARRPRHLGAGGNTIDVCTWHIPAQCIVRADNVLEGHCLKDCASIRPETAFRCCGAVGAGSSLRFVITDLVNHGHVRCDGTMKSSAGVSLSWSKAIRWDGRVEALDVSSLPHPSASAATWS
jgi:hypothetical protein